MIKRFLLVLLVVLVAGCDHDFAHTKQQAEQGDAGAQFKLGWMYNNGEGVPQDYAEAVKWYRLAAKQGNARAQNNLGVMYGNGEGVSQNYAEAVKWYRLAAEQGNARAQYNISRAYALGKGVEQNYAEAAKWTRLAAEQEIAEAQHNLDKLNRLASYPTSNASYKELEAEVGCRSKYSDDKKRDIFNSRYKNHWMTWRGEVVLAESSRASLDVNDFGTQDLSVEFASKKAGYDLIKGSFITVRFLMKTEGGCFLPFGGDTAIIVE